MRGWRRGDGGYADGVIGILPRYCRVNCGSALEEPRSAQLLLQLPLRGVPGLFWSGAPILRSTPNWVVPDDSLSLAEAACRRRGRPPRSEYFTVACQIGVAELGGFDFRLRRWNPTKAKDKKLVLYGDGQPLGACHLQEPLQPQALVRSGLRGDHPVAATPARRVRVGLVV